MINDVVRALTGVTQFRLVCLSFTVAMSGCDLLGIETKCEAILVPGIVVAVVDSTSNSPITNEVVTVVATDGAYADTATSAHSFREDEIPVVEDRPGTYNVSISAPSYRTLTFNGVVVRKRDDCHVATTRLNARLQRQ